MTTVRSEDSEDGVRLLTLDRPPANAITPTLLRDISAALDRAREDDAVRAVVLTGEGRFFSAGLDLRGGIDFQALSSTGTPTDPFLPLRDCLLNFLRFPKPSVAMLRGHAIAGGLILLLACDYRLGLEGDYRIGLNEVAIGASFPKAARLGVVDELLPADSIDETVFRRATRLGSFPRDAYAHTKAALVAETIARIESETPEEAQRAAAVWLSAESVAARAAQAQKLSS